MPSESLFAYSVEEQDGKLVITLQGRVAEDALRGIRSDIEAGHSRAFRGLLSPLVPLRRLVSSAVRLRGRERLLEGEEAEDAAGGNLLSQEVEQGFSAFQQQLRDFRQSLDELRGEVATPAAAQVAGAPAGAAGTPGAEGAPPAAKKSAPAAR